MFRKVLLWARSVIFDGKLEQPTDADAKAAGQKYHEATKRARKVVEQRNHNKAMQPPSTDLAKRIDAVMKKMDDYRREELEDFNLIAEKNQAMIACYVSHGLNYIEEHIGKVTPEKAVEYILDELLLEAGPIVFAIGLDQAHEIGIAKKRGKEKLYFYDPNYECVSYENRNELMADWKRNIG
ncbi:MAG: hypothetical protein MZW92_76135 [Comamonadaceae bacterium]|nr:hypothetical protein [Comamonadaceae bacterium]